VIHACEYARDVLPVVEGQIAVGMRPFIVTPSGAGSAELYLAGRTQEPPPALSLLRSWQDVRNWRKSILECDPETTADLVHAHSFSSGMAAVRGVNCVVYDLHGCIEELAISAHQCESGSWMARSFRVAEQFILSRTAAVIVHSLAMKDAVRDRGTTPENIFLIPDPLPFDDDDRPSLPVPLGLDLLAQRFGLQPEHVATLVPNTIAELTPAVIEVMEAFASASFEAPELRLLLPVAEESRGAVAEMATKFQIEERTVLSDPADVLALMQAAHVIVLNGEPPHDLVEQRKPNPFAVRALYHGRALLAADVPCNRDASPEGRGCLWFERGNVRDLGHRIAFLARHPEFRIALGDAGRSFLLDTRNLATLGEKYKEAYRHAATRRRPNGTGQGMPSLQPAASWGAT